MHFATIFTTLTVLAMGAAADPVPKSSDLPFNIVSSRIWGDENCGADNNDHNLGELTLHRDEIGKCAKFSGPAVKSVKQFSHAGNCKIVLYSDSNCKRGKKEVKDGQCRATSGSFRSYKAVC
ncbi:hypothetical protein F53441_3261 [Fusarium austroafricanum]|uniref:Uncharacterized protein n=1 Tax=Fusarium austroafricanum TaxID=2364996 RepID=A0A8H4P077_9HYPO|nr:hypothetical protein F53441_3261 [Fusarium austroafricanum]